MCHVRVEPCKIPTPTWNLLLRNVDFDVDVVGNVLTEADVFGNWLEEVLCNVEVEESLRTIGSTAGNPTNVNRSANMADFNRTSNGVSQPNDGDKFTSNSHGFKFESIRISNPYSSKQLFGCWTNIRQAVTMDSEHANMDLITTSSIDSINFAVSSPSLRKWRNNALNVHLWPTSSAEGSSDLKKQLKLS